MTFGNELYLHQVFSRPYLVLGFSIFGIGSPGLSRESCEHSYSGCLSVHAGLSQGPRPRGVVETPDQ